MDLRGGRHLADAGRAALVVDVGHVLVAEELQGAEHRVGRGLAQPAQAGVLDHVAQVLQQLQVGVGAPPVGDAAQQVVHLGRADPAGGIQPVLLGALVLAFAGATFDVVIDAFRIEHLKPNELGIGSGMSQYGWRLGSFFAASLALCIAGLANWQMGYFACAPLVLPALLVSLWAGEPEERRKREWPQRLSKKGYATFLLAIPALLLAGHWLDNLLNVNILFRIAVLGLIYPIFDLF